MFLSNTFSFSAVRTAEEGKNKEKAYSCLFLAQRFRVTSCKCAKKVVSDSPGLRKDFAIGLVCMVDKSTDHRKLSPWLDEMKPNFETDSLP